MLSINFKPVTLYQGREFKKVESPTTQKLNTLTQDTLSFKSGNTLSAKPSGTVSPWQKLTQQLSFTANYFTHLQNQETDDLEAFLTNMDKANETAPSQEQEEMEILRQMGFIDAPPTTSRNGGGYQSPLDDFFNEPIAQLPSVEMSRAQSPLDEMTDFGRPQSNVYPPDVCPPENQWGNQDTYGVTTNMPEEERGELFDLVAELSGERQTQIPVIEEKSFSEPPLMEFHQQLANPDVEAQQIESLFKSLFEDPSPVKKTSGNELSDINAAIDLSAEQFSRIINFLISGNKRINNKVDNDSLSTKEVLAILKADEASRSSDQEIMSPQKVSALVGLANSNKAEEHDFTVDELASVIKTLRNELK